ncbi:hypothetical protein [Tahibacter soli]|uniref:Thioredoxin domain-containing protein n=1 Tax=Tahibacter soli TaxID=2983605 RepID=A0A9X4BIC5_9GAMM|nr:hypothetical protein [Tahibacter soli]MDC8012087.1 hypothetical protein [Tahibacter soli]
MRRIDAEFAEPSQKAPLLEKELTSIVATAESKGLAALGDDDARDLYDAARMAAYYGYGARAASTMRRAWDELARRRIAPPGSADEVVETHVAARLFDDASVFHRRHTQAVTIPLPAFVDLRARPRGPTLLEVADDGSTLRRREFPGAAVVVVGSPWCGFSRAATTAIEDDRELATVMAGHARWLIPQQIVRDVRAVARWNREHPTAAMAMIYRRSEWPYIRSSATPAFYFFRDGQLVSSFSGWAGAEQKAALLAGLRAAGVVSGAESTQAD